MNEIIASFPIYIADAFTDRAYAGNPAAVAFPSEALADDLMQSIAAEMNLSETSFLHRGEDGFSLRWFTPKTEVKLCGHATLAAAHVIWDSHRQAPDRPLVFHTLSGPLTATRLSDGATELDFPSRQPTALAQAPSGLLDALGAAQETIWVGQDEDDYLIEIATEESLRRLRPDMRLLGEIDTRGIIVTARSSQEGIDFVSRYFAPRAGIPEDPVTGSAHCALAPFWSERLQKARMTGYQASERGGAVTVEIRDQRIALTGRCVITMDGQFLLRPQR